MSEPTNTDRAEWAEIAILAFEAEVRGDREDSLTDLLCDLMHWADRNNMNFQTELRKAAGNYAEELQEAML